MHHRLPALAAFAALLSASMSALPADAGRVSGEKLDSGLGDLPHYSQWVDKTGQRPLGHRVIGESLDSGLGELPHYRHWVDPTGKDPLGRQRTSVAVAAR